jgi:hypothetical protein
MKSRDQWAQEQEEYLKAYDEIRQQLLQIPGVLEVGVGVKETGSELTENVCFRVYVEEKIPEADLSEDEMIPKTIRGLRTDVIKRINTVDLIGFDDENDERNYSVKVGGIRIGNDKHMGQGTLGCFCRLTSDNSVVFLSNYHVLYSGSATVGAKVGQPDYKASWCCTCNNIGEVIDGADKPLDCAIAKLNSDVPFKPKVRQIKRPDGTLELNGFISGSGAAVSHDEVWKVGAETGLTRGTLAQVTPDIIIHPKAPYTKIGEHGDSGSVVVSSATGQVVGLLKQIDDQTGTLGKATLIQDVLTRLHITIIPTDPSEQYDVSLYEEDELTRFSDIARSGAFADIADRLRASEAGRDLLRLFDTHWRECVALVNQQRAVTVAWHRNQGPTFMAALARSAREPIYHIPQEINGVSREHFLRAMQTALAAHGSESLRADLDAYAARLLEVLTTCETANELLSAWEASDPLAYVAAVSDGVVP